MKNLAVEFDGTPCAVKAACTVWSGGKSGDYIKRLPIAIWCRCFLDFLVKLRYSETKRKQNST